MKIEGRIVWVGMFEEVRRAVLWHENEKE